MLNALSELPRILLLVVLGRVFRFFRLEVHISVSLGVESVEKDSEASRRLCRNISYLSI